ncbi:uncharacterized protein LOC143558472 [Bidens hawaiensis]|uniref:uncharacterized protein LOC143558472 n=1 Tax=Bidens hawaiensis TaxID=980011 RepID=UPI00404B4A0C
MGDALPPRRTVHSRANEGVMGRQSAITRSAMPDASNWHIPPNVMNSITNSSPFHGLEDEDVSGYLNKFTRICNTFHIANATRASIYLHLFPFSLEGRASSWLENLPPGSITTWDELQDRFLKKYFPPSKASRRRDQIYSFRMDADDLYPLDWERFHNLLSRCPQHGLSEWAVVEKFYNMLTFEMQQRFHTSAGGYMLEKLDIDKRESMFESFALADQPGSSARGTSKTITSSARGVHQVSNDTSIMAALEAIQREIKVLKKVVNRCEICRGGHDTVDCPVDQQEQVEYLGNHNRGQNAYGNPGWRNSSNYGWRSGGNAQGFQPRQEQSQVRDTEVAGSSSAGKRSGMDPDLKEFLSKQSTMLSHLIDRDNNTHNRLAEHDTLLKNQQSSILEMSRKMDEMMKHMLPNKQVGAFQGSTELNPKAQLNAVTTCSGRGGDREQPPADDEEPVDEEIEMEAPVRTHERRALGSTASNGESPAKKVAVKKIEEKKSPEVNLTRVPYPARVLRQKYVEEYGHFLDMFKQLKINLPFVEALQHMPKYAKFLKDLLSNKKKLEGLSTVCLNEGCSAVVQNNLPEKLADPGHFTIPCLFGSSIESYALADLGASINLMPYSLNKKLDLGEPVPTSMSLSLADRSVKYPRGIVKNVLVKFVFPVDFVILDMEADDQVPLILGRPFLRTAEALIDVFDRKMHQK